MTRNSSRIWRSLRLDALPTAITPRRLTGAATHPARAFRSTSIEHPFGCHVKHSRAEYLTLNTASSGRLKTRLGRPVASLLLVAALLVAAGCGSFEVTVGAWRAGDSNLRGSISNDTGAACTDPEVTLHLRDHNGAIVRDFTFGAGELAAGQTRPWKTHLVGLLFADAPIEANVTAIDADASCADSR